MAVFNDVWTEGEICDHFNQNEHIGAPSYFHCASMLKENIITELIFIPSMPQHIQRTIPNLRSPFSENAVEDN